MAAAVVGVGLVLRAWPRSALWLDEAQSVSFARLAATDIPHALREDGAPPLYYLVLHAWIKVFGTTDVAVRSLSILISLLGLVALGAFVLRRSGTGAALITMAVIAVNPFAVRYGSETRMYALVMLEVAIGLLLLQRIDGRPTRRQLTGIACTSAALLYTHYWSIYLLVAFGLVLLVDAVRWRATARGTSSFAIAVAVAIGSVLWLPWVPTFLFQSRHTATPWSRRAGPAALADALGLRFSGVGAVIPIFAVLACAAGALALAGAVRDRGAARPDGSGWSIGVAGLALVMVLGTLFALVGAMASDSALAPRYLSVVFPLAMILVGAGIDAIGWKPAGATLLAALLMLGTVLSVREIGNDRTRAEALVAAMSPALTDGDVVVYCPDQLGPAMSRLLDRRTTIPNQISYLPPSVPERVDWIDYRKRYEAADPVAFVHRVEDLAGDGTIWLVVSTTYPPTEQPCTELLEQLRSERPDGQRIVVDDPSTADHGALWRFEPSS